MTHRLECNSSLVQAHHNLQNRISQAVTVFCESFDFDRKVFRDRNFLSLERFLKVVATSVSIYDPDANLCIYKADEKSENIQSPHF